jgi:hypothetical protein
MSISAQQRKVNNEVLGNKFEKAKLILDKFEEYCTAFESYNNVRIDFVKSLKLKGKKAEDLKLAVAILKEYYFFFAIISDEFSYLTCFDEKLPKLHFTRPYHEDFELNADYLITVESKKIYYSKNQNSKIESKIQPVESKQSDLNTTIRRMGRAVEDFITEIMAKFNYLLITKVSNLSVRSEYLVKDKENKKLITALKFDDSSYILKNSFEENVAKLKEFLPVKNITVSDSEENDTTKNNNSSKKIDNGKFKIIML